MDLRTKLEAALGSSFKIVRELGGGGMSRVFLAEDETLGREIVVKVIPVELAGQVNTERFRREIQVAARLQHPCIVPVLNSGLADGLPYYTMPFVEGESLRSRLSREKGLSVQETTRILRDVAGAVAYAHEHGVVHRDIKPDNILVTKHHAVLVDFGVAKALTDSTRSDAGLTSVGIALGTPAYMAPEQASADPSVDHRADIYSLGAVAYEMLAGRHPFEGRSSQAILAAHAIEKPLTIDSHRPNIPRALSDLVMRMLEKHPGDRPQSADEVLATLDQVTTPASQAATPLQATSKNDNQKRKRLIVVSASAGAVLTILGISLFAFRGKFQTEALAPANVLVLQPMITGVATPATSAGADRILDAVSRGLAQVTTAHVVAAPDQSSSNPEKAAALGRRAGAGKVVMTSIYPAGDKLQVQFRLVDASSGEIIRTLTPVRVSQDPSIQELDSATDPMLSLVGFATSPLLGSSAIPLQGLPRFAAFKEFETGINLGVNIDPVSAEAAMRHLITAFELDSTFIQPRLWQMWVSRSSGAVRNSRERAFEYDTLQAYVLNHRTGMSPFEREVADFVTDRIATERAVQALHRILAFNPTNPMRRDIPRMLADLNRPYAADSAMTALLAADSSNNSVTSFWLFRVSLYHYMGDYKQSLEAARHARKIGPSDIGALRAELSALAALGDTVNLEKLLGVVGFASRNRGFFDFAGDLYLSASLELTAHGHTAAGRAILNKATDWFDKRTPEDWKNQSIAFRGALAYMVAGKLTDAEGLMNGLVKHYPEDLRYSGALGRLAALKGDTAEALRIAQSLAELPSEKFSGSPAFERAQIMAELNRRDDAVALLQEAFGQGVGFANYRIRIHTFQNFVRMLGYPPFESIITPRG